MRKHSCMPLETVEKIRQTKLKQKNAMIEAGSMRAEWVKTIKASEAKRLTRSAIGKILKKEEETLGEDILLSHAILQKVFEKIKAEAQQGSTFCYVSLTEEEYYHSCSGYILAFLSEYGYKAECKAGFICAIWS